MRYPPLSPIQHAAYRLAALLAFNRITLVDRPALPPGPVLYLGLHRNGAVDGVPYVKAAPHAIFLVSAQLHRSALGRFFFPGIPVARGKDRQRGIAADNQASMADCVNHLAEGGELFIMPEGTSSLGPRHLPFKPGAARIAHAVVSRGISLTVVPVAVHYECAWQWQSRVEVLFGKPLHIAAGTTASARELHESFSAALVEVGINVDSAERLAQVEMLAYGATLGNQIRYTDCLKRFEREIPADIVAAVNTLEALADQGPVLRHQGVALIPIRHAWAYWLFWLLMAPLMLAFAVSNLPVLLAGQWAANSLPDDRNVIAFWRLAAGLPAAALWLPLMAGGLAWWAGPLAALAYGLISLAGLRSVYRFRKLSVAVFNSLLARRLRQPLLALHEKLTRCVS